jgi:hypothetical protein
MYGYGIYLYTGNYTKFGIGFVFGIGIGKN